MLAIKYLRYHISVIDERVSEAGVFLFISHAVLSCGIRLVTFTSLMIVVPRTLAFLIVVSVRHGLTHLIIHALIVANRTQI